MLHDFPHPDRVVVGALGPVGQRSYVVQMRQQDQLVTVALARDAVLSIAERIESLLKQAAALGWIGDQPPGEPEFSPLDAPVEVLFDVHAVGWALDLSRGAILLEFYPGDIQNQEQATLVQAWLYPSMARDFAARARAIVTTADPTCPFCSQPIHAAGHICPRSNGYRSPLFSLD